jgi:4-hydroxybenzoate polyprenyltransferase
MPGNSQRSLALDLLELCRPRQWSKNLLLFAALLFSGNFLHGSDFKKACLAFVSFVLLSSSLYALNDVLDAPEDRLHPLKKLRPVAAGRVLGPIGLAFSLGLALAAFTVSSSLSAGFVGVAAAYFISTVAYSLWVKHVVILDVFFIALGFVLRAVAGGLAISAPVSEWLLLCTTLLALFLALAKRRHELVLLQGQAVTHRRALMEYSPALLDEMMGVVTSSTVLAYALYTFQAHRWHDLPLLMLTIPFVLYGIFRYLYLVHQKGQGGSPESVLLKDGPMVANLLIWIAVSAGILYFELKG